MLREDAHNRLRQIADEWAAVDAVLRSVITTSASNPTVLPSATPRSRLVAASSRLESKYIIAAFAIFEDAIRSYYATYRRGRPDMMPLLSTVARRRRVPEKTFRLVDAVRDERNGIVHHARTNTMRLNDVIGRTNRFISFLPVGW